MTDVNFSGIIPYVVYPIVVAGILGIYAYVRRKFGCIDVVAARSLRQSHALIQNAYRQDEITQALHPDSLVKSNLGPMMESALKDEKGNL